MSGSPQLLEVGHITKAHGLRGEVVVNLVTDRTERLAAGAVLTTKKGPMTVTRSRRQGARFVVEFEGVATREAAEALAGVTLLAEPIDDPEALWVHELVGTLVVDLGGQEHGRCVAVLENPAHDLLELDSGALVPIVFVKHLVDGVVTIDPPEGLFEL